MAKTPAWCAAALALVTVSSVTRLGAAQTPTGRAPCGCVAGGFGPPAVGAGAFAADLLESFTGEPRPAVGALTALGYRPLSILNGDGSTRADLVKYQLVE